MNHPSHHSGYIRPAQPIRYVVEIIGGNQHLQDGEEGWGYNYDLTTELSNEEFTFEKNCAPEDNGLYCEQEDIVAVVIPRLERLLPLGASLSNPKIHYENDKGYDTGLADVVYVFDVISAPEQIGRAHV